MPRVLLEDIEIDVVEEESPEFNNLITEKPVERGQDVADHARNLPISFTFSGVVTGPDAAQKLEQLRNYRNDRQLLKYIGRNVLNNMMIESFSTKHVKTNLQGFGFSITLKQIRIATLQVIDIVAPASVSTSVSGKAGTASQVKPVEDRGTQQPQEQVVDDGRRNSMLYNLFDSAGSYFKKTSGADIDAVTGAAPRAN